MRHLTLITRTRNTCARNLLAICMSWLLAAASHADLSPPSGMIERMGLGPSLSGTIHFNSDINLQSPLRISAAAKNSGNAPSAEGEIYVTFGGNAFRTENIRLPVIQPGETKYFHFSSRHELPKTVTEFLRDDWGGKLYEVHIVIEGADRVIARQNLTLNYSYSAHPHTAKSYSVRVPAAKSGTAAGISNPNIEKLNIPLSSKPAPAPAAQTPGQEVPTDSIRRPEIQDIHAIPGPKPASEAPASGNGSVTELPGKRPANLPPPPLLRSPRPISPPGP